MECAADAEERKRHFEGAIVVDGALPLGVLVELGHDRFVNPCFGEHPLEKLLPSCHKPSRALTSRSLGLQGP